MKKACQDFTRWCSYTNHVRWASYTSFGCKFPKVYMCQKLWKLAGSWQSYCKKYQAYFFGFTLYVAIIHAPALLQVRVVDWTSHYLIYVAKATHKSHVNPMFSSAVF